MLIKAMSTHSLSLFLEILCSIDDPYHLSLSWKQWERLCQKGSSEIWFPCEERSRLIWHSSTCPWLDKLMITCCPTKILKFVSLAVARKLFNCVSMFFSLNSLSFWLIEKNFFHLQIEIGECERAEIDASINNYLINCHRSHQQLMKKFCFSCERKAWNNFF